MSQAIKRRITPHTRAGQYMCPKCGEIFETKLEVDNHVHKTHKPEIKSVHDNLNGIYIE